MKIDTKLVSEAINLMTGSILSIAKSSAKEKKGVSVTIIYGRINEQYDENVAEPELKMVHQIGESAAKYDDFAEKKADLSWRTGADGRVVTEGFHSVVLLKEGKDCVYAGSYSLTIGHIRLVVATSALDPAEDEAIARIIAVAIFMLLQRKVSSARDAKGIIPE